MLLLVISLYLSPAEWLSILIDPFRHLSPLSSVTLHSMAALASLLLES